MAAFWVVQGGAIAPFRAFPTRDVPAKALAARPAVAAAVPVDQEPGPAVSPVVDAPAAEQPADVDPSPEIIPEADPDAGKMR